MKRFFLLAVVAIYATSVEAATWQPAEEPTSQNQQNQSPKKDKKDKEE